MNERDDMNPWSGWDSTTTEAYELLLSLTALADDDVAELVACLAYGADAEALADRWEREHVRNMARWLEARIFHDPDPTDPYRPWVALPHVGFASERRFETEIAAREWIGSGGMYERDDARPSDPDSLEVTR